MDIDNFKKKNKNPAVENFQIVKKKDKNKNLTGKEASSWCVQIPNYLAPGEKYRA